MQSQSSSILDCTFCHIVRRRFYHYHRRATSNKIHRPVNPPLPPRHLDVTKSLPEPQPQLYPVSHPLDIQPTTTPPQPHLHLTKTTMCIQYIILWILCGHHCLFDFISCEMGNQPLPPGRCRTGGVTAQIDFRPGARCPDCLRALAERQPLRRQSAPALFNRQAVDASRNRGASLITEGLQRLATVSLPF